MCFQKYLKKITYFFFSLALVFQPITAMAANNDDAYSLDQNNATGITLSTFVREFYTYLSIITALASLMMLMIAAYVYMTSNGDANKVKKTKEYISSAIIGLITVALAYAFFEILNPGILTK